jgi:hypothetical protein
MNDITKNSDGTISWTHLPSDYYVATGTTRDGKRFRTASFAWKWISGINLWRGNKWLVRNGKRHKLVSVVN